MGAGGLQERRRPDGGARRALTASACIAILSLADAGHARDAWSSTVLPPPPQGPEAVDDMILHLELVVNGLATGKVVPVTVRAGRYHVAAADLRGVGIPAESEGGELVALDSLPGVRVDYDAATLRLLIDVPVDWLPQQTLGRDRIYDYEPARSSLGALVNYDLYANDPDRGPSSLSVWNELRVFGPFGLFSTTGVYRAVGGNAPGNGFRRYDSSWRQSDERSLLTYEVGDLITRSLSWGSSVRLGGIQISRDFAIRPDVITYPLPRFAGDAAAPSAVDLFINGYRAEGADVRPGPFTLLNVPFVNGAGEAVLVVTDALGRQVSTTIPFYVSSDLLRRGLSDFSVAAGFVRRDYGIKDFSYGTGAASASFRHGLTDDVTVELHGEAGERFGLAGAGAVFRLGNAGVINAAWSHSRRDGRGGDQWSLGYRYNGRNFNLMAQHNRRSSGFADLSVYDGEGVSLSRRSTSVTGSLSIERFGSFGAGYFDSSTRNGPRTRLANLSWALPLWGNASLYASGNHEIGRARWSAALQIILSLGRNRGSASSSVEHSPGRGTAWRSNYSRTAPIDGGIGWNLSYAKGSREEGYVQADLAWRIRQAELRGGIFGSGGNYTRWGSATGSVVMMDGSAFVANRINDAFTVVSTSGQAGVPVRYENQFVGKTDGNGHLLIPWANSFYRAKYAIDPLGLPPIIETPLVEQRVAVRRGSGYLLDFPMARVVAATVRLHDAAGAPLPVGAAVTVNGTPGAYVGWDGIAYVEKLQAHNRLEVHLPGAASCTASFELDVAADRIARIGPLTCLAERAP